MKTLIFKATNCLLNNQIPPSISHCYIPSISRKNCNFLNFPTRNWGSTPRSLTCFSTTASESLGYGGWDGPRLNNDPVSSGESNQLRNFLNSLGMDDKKYIFVSLLGFVCALAISRVKVSSIVIFPACAIVFAVGFSVGLVNGGYIDKLSLIGNKKSPKDENVRVSVQKLKSLVDFIDGFDDTLCKLKKDIEKGIECNHITVVELERYVSVIESIGLSATDSRGFVEACIENLLGENQEVKKTLNQKSSRQRKEVGGNGFDLLQSISSLFQENVVGSKPKIKDGIKRDSTHLEVNSKSPPNVLSPPVEKRAVNSVSNGYVGIENAGFAGDSPNRHDMDYGRIEKSSSDGRRINLKLENDRKNHAEVNTSVKRVFGSEEYIYRNNRLSYTDHRVSLNMSHHNEAKRWTSRDNLLDFVDSTTRLEMETEETFGQGRALEESNENYEPSIRREKSNTETYRSRVEEERTIPEGEPSVNDNHESAYASDFGSSPSSSISDDMVFNRYLMEANVLLKQARECLRHRDDVDLGNAESVLVKSAKLLSRAIDMKPMSLLAVGQLGNTYLLHGELKLKISRELRALLVSSDPLLVEKWKKVVKGLDDHVTSRDEIAGLLVNVCEECEKLLIESGRKYRLALSIDGNDMRALYNWGLALSFRAQLIADIGPEAAFDADKVFLAAIDKFDAMMSKSNAYAPDALFRWGVALQQRSRLRPRNSKEKVKLLQQAKRLFEDALGMDSTNLQLREALSSCITELNFRDYQSYDL